MGYGLKDIESIWEGYKQQLVFASNNSQGVYGVLAEIDPHKEYADFKPSIVYTPDGRAHINSTKATRITLPIHSIRPLPDGESLEKMVADYNQKQEKAAEKK